MSAKLTILGAGSLLPTRYNFPSAQILELRDKRYMIDCGEGAQIRMRQMGLKNTRLNHIFISHLHGDHCFGLMGLISSFALLNRTAELQVHGPLGITKLFEQQMNFFCDGIPFKVSFQEFDTLQHKLIYADRSVEVYSIPLKHRVPCSGFLFKEKPKDRHLIRDMIDFIKFPYPNGISSRKELILFGRRENHTQSFTTTEPDDTISYAYVLFRYGIFRRDYPHYIQGGFTVSRSYFCRFGNFEGEKDHAFDRRAGSFHCSIS